MKNNKPIPKGRMIVFMLIFSLFIFLNPLQNDISLVQAATDTYFEDFSTTTYMDAAYTNASGWGDDYLTNAKKQPIIAGSLSNVMIGSIIDIYVDGNYAYCGTAQNEFRVANITYPNNPVHLNSCSIDGIGNSITVSGNYAYVAANDQGLKIINITKPESPYVVGSIDTDGNAKDVVISGDYAYIADGSHGLKVIDISNPTLPSSGVTWIYDTPNIATGIIIEGDYAYISDISSIQIVDISDPTSPVFAGEYAGITSVNKFSVQGDLAFIANLDGLIVLNITDPTSPEYITTFGTIGLIDLIIDGNYIYTTDYNDTFQVLDITSPLKPVKVGTCSMPALSQGLFLSGSYVYVAPYELGLRVIEVNDLNEELNYKGIILSSLTGYTLEGVQQICIKGNILFVAETKGLLILNISDPENPEYVGSYSYLVTDYSIGIAVEGNYAFLSDNTGRLTVVNVTDITNPTFTGSCDTPGIGWDIEICGDYLFMADWQGGLHSIDISDPANPTIVDSYAIDGFSAMITVYGDYLYLSVFSGLSVSGLFIFDISNPNSLNYVNIYSVTDPRILSISGEYGYLAADDDGLIILDMTNPSEPKHVNSVAILDLWDAKISGDYAFLTRRSRGFFVYNISNPIDPIFIDSHDVSIADLERYIVFYGDYAFVTSAHYGLKIYEVKKNKAKQFDSPCEAQSKEVFSNINREIFNATLISNATIPADTSIEYYLSADNGVNWEQVTNDTLHSFVNTGYQLKWRAILTTQNISYTPYLYSIEIEYTSFLISPGLTTPTDGFITDDYTPTFTWTGINGESNYLFQLDTTTSFATPLLNLTLPSSSTSYTPSSSLAIGTYYWRVAGIDSNGEIGLFSSYRSITILLDTTNPVIDHPDDVSYELGQTGNDIIWHPTDINPNRYMIIYDGIIQVDTVWNGGSITYNVDGQSVGIVTATCYVYDADDNFIQDSVIVTVSTTQPPTIDDITDFNYEEGTTGNSITWHPSDSNPYWFNVTRNGVVIDEGAWSGSVITVDIDGLTYGTYTYICSVYDLVGLSSSDTVVLSVTDSVLPVVSEPINLEIEEGSTGNNIVWEVSDNNPGTYIVYKDGILYETDTWTSGSSIIVSVDGQSAGEYNFTIVVTDIAGNLAKDTVIVTVTPTVPEFNQSVFLAIISITAVFVFYLFRRRTPKKG